MPPSPLRQASLRFFVMGLVCFGGLWACDTVPGPQSPGSPQSETLQAVSIERQAITLKVDEAPVVVAVTIRPRSAADDLRMRASDPATSEVTLLDAQAGENGSARRDLHIKPLQPGQNQVEVFFVSAPQETQTLLITVTSKDEDETSPPAPSPPTGLTWHDASDQNSKLQQLLPGDSFSLLAQVIPTNAIQNVSWEITAESTNTPAEAVETTWALSPQTDIVVSEADATQERPHGHQRTFRVPQSDTVYPGRYIITAQVSTSDNPQAPKIKIKTTVEVIHGLRLSTKTIALNQGQIDGPVSFDVGFVPPVLATAQTQPKLSIAASESENDFWQATYAQQTPDGANSPLSYKVTLTPVDNDATPPSQPTSLALQIVPAGTSEPVLAGSIPVTVVPPLPPLVLSATPDASMGWRFGTSIEVRASAGQATAQEPIQWVLKGDTNNNQQAKDWLNAQNKQLEQNITAALQLTDVPSGSFQLTAAYGQAFGPAAVQRFVVHPRIEIPNAAFDLKRGGKDGRTTRLRDPNTPSTMFSVNGVDQQQKSDGMILGLPSAIGFALNWQWKDPDLAEEHAVTIERLQATAPNLFATQFKAQASADSNLPELAYTLCSQVPPALKTEEVWGHEDQCIQRAVQLVDTLKPESLAFDFGDTDPTHAFWQVAQSTANDAVCVAGPPIYACVSTVPQQSDADIRNAVLTTTRLPTLQADWAQDSDTHAPTCPTGAEAAVFTPQMQAGSAAGEIELRVSMLSADNNNNDIQTTQITYLHPQLRPIEIEGLHLFAHHGSQRDLRSTLAATCPPQAVAIDAQLSEATDELKMKQETSNTIHTFNIWATGAIEASESLQVHLCAAPEVLAQAGLKPCGSADDAPGYTHTLNIQAEEFTHTLTVGAGESTHKVELTGIDNQGRYLTQIENVFWPGFDPQLRSEDSGDFVFQNVPRQDDVNWAWLETSAQNFAGNTQGRGIALWSAKTGVDIRTTLAADTAHQLLIARAEQLEGSAAEFIPQKEASYIATAATLLLRERSAQGDADLEHPSPEHIAVGDNTPNSNGLLELLFVASATDTTAPHIPRLPTSDRLSWDEVGEHTYTAAQTVASSTEDNTTTASLNRDKAFTAPWAAAREALVADLTQEHPNDLRRFWQEIAGSLRSSQQSFFGHDFFEARIGSVAHYLAGHAAIASEQELFVQRWATMQERLSFLDVDATASESEQLPRQLAEHAIAAFSYVLNTDSTDSSTNIIAKKDLELTPFLASLQASGDEITVEERVTAAIHDLMNTVFLKAEIQHDAPMAETVRAQMKASLLLPETASNLISDFDALFGKGFEDTDTQKIARGWRPEFGATESLYQSSPFMAQDYLGYAIAAAIGDRNTREHNNDDINFGILWINTNSIPTVEDTTPSDRLMAHYSYGEDIPNLSDDSGMAFWNDSPIQALSSTSVFSLQHSRHRLAEFSWLHDQVQRDQIRSYQMAPDQTDADTDPDDMLPFDSISSNTHALTVPVACNAFEGRVDGIHCRGVDAVIKALLEVWLKPDWRGWHLP